MKNMILQYVKNVLFAAVLGAVIVTAVLGFVGLVHGVFSAEEYTKSESQKTYVIGTIDGKVFENLKRNVGTSSYTQTNGEVVMFNYRTVAWTKFTIETNNEAAK
jgi:hypothetical protein